MIQDTTHATPRLDDYRKQVFLGLRELQTRVNAAGGIEALFAPLIDGPKKDWDTCVSAAWSWYKQELELLPHEYACFPAECGGDLIRLAGWDSEDGGDYLDALGEFEQDLDGVQSTWVSMLYPEDSNEDDRFEGAMALIENGGVPLDVEWAAIGITPEHLLWWLGHERSQNEWNSRFYGGGGSYAGYWADYFWAPAISTAISTALEHFQSEGALIHDDMDEYQVATMVAWLEENDVDGAALQVLKAELARLEDGEDEDEDDTDSE